MLRHTRVLGLVGLLSLTISTAACGGGVTGEAPASSTGSPSPSSSEAGASQTTRTLAVDDAGVLNVGWTQLGAQPTCDREEASESVRIDFSTKHVARLATFWTCDSKGERSPGGSTSNVKAEMTLSDEQAASVLAMANRIELRTIDGCVAYDGTSFHVSIKRGDGTWSSYTDGISFGCKEVAIGQKELFRHVNALLPGTPKREPAY